MVCARPGLGGGAPALEVKQRVAKEAEREGRVEKSGRKGAAGRLFEKRGLLGRLSKES
jgi:hypothetical protein